MNDLNELIWVLTKHKVKEVEVISNLKGANPSNRYHKFYVLLCEKKFSSEKEYAQYFKYKNEHDANYKRFRRTFKRRLHNSTLFIDLNDKPYNDMQRAIQLCQEKAAIVNNLMARGARSSAIEIIIEYLPLVIKYNWIDLCYNWVKHLRYHYSLMGNKKMHKYYSQHFENYENILIWENKAALYHENVTIHQVNSDAGKKELKNICGEYLGQLLPKIGRVDSIRFEFFTAFIELNYCMLGHDWHSTIEKTSAWLAYLKPKIGFSPAWENILLYQKIISQIMVEKHEDASESLEKILSQAAVGSMYWFKGIYLYAFNALQTDNYTLAWEKIQEIKRNDRYHYNLKKYKEQIEILQAYLQVLSYLDYFPLSSVEKGSLNLGEFLTKIPIGIKDKKGLNIAILLLQIFLLLAEKDYERADERIRAIADYAKRHIDQKNELYRSYLMISLVKKIKSQEYNIRKIEKKSELFFVKLKNAPLRDADQNHGIEIIKYEKFWLMMLDALRGKYTKQVRPIFQSIRKKEKEMHK